MKNDIDNRLSKSCLDFDKSMSLLKLITLKTTSYVCHDFDIDIKMTLTIANRLSY